MITKFETGKYYKYIGPKITQEQWNYDGEMDFVFDDKPHMCIQAHHRCFSWAILSGNDNEWAWGDLSYFVEVNTRQQLELFDV